MFKSWSISGGIKKGQCRSRIYKRQQCVKNYRPVSLFPICSETSERIIYNNTYNYLIDNNLISQNQSGFKRGDFCINQLISSTHDILNSLDESLEVRGVFLDNSKAFGKVWHKALIYKLQQNGISGELLNILTDFLKNTKQRVVLNGQSSDWIDLKAGEPEGSIMGLLLFLIYINVLPEGLITNAKLFADDCLRHFFELFETSLLVLKNSTMT